MSAHGLKPDTLPSFIEGHFIAITGLASEDLPLAAIAAAPSEFQDRHHHLREKAAGDT